MAAERACKYPQEIGFLTVVLPELIEAAQSHREDRASRSGSGAVEGEDSAQLVRIGRSASRRARLR